MNNLFAVNGPVYRIGDTCVRLLTVNLLLLVTSLPLVTIGTSITSAHQVSRYIIDGRSSHVIREYFGAFREHWKKSTFLWLGCSTVLIILLVDLIYLITTKSLFSWPMIGIAIVFLLVEIILQFGLPLIGYCNTPLLQVIPLAVKLCLAHPLISLLLMGITTAPIVLGLLSPYLLVFGMYISLFIGPAFSIFLQQHLLLYIFKKHES